MKSSPRKIRQSYSIVGLASTVVILVRIRLIYLGFATLKRFRCLGTTPRNQPSDNHLFEIVSPRSQVSKAGCLMNLTWAISTYPSVFFNTSTGDPEVELGPLEHNSKKICHSSLYRGQWKERSNLRNVGVQPAFATCESSINSRAISLPLVTILTCSAQVQFHINVISSKVILKQAKVKTTQCLVPLHCSFQCLPSASFPSGIGACRRISMRISMCPQFSFRKPDRILLLRLPLAR